MPGPHPGGSFEPQPRYSAQQPYGQLPMFVSGQIQPGGRRKSRKRLILGISAAAVVVTVVAGVVLFTGAGSRSGADTAGEAVQVYLEALARGDAEAALAAAVEVPPDTTFLTDEILRRQLEKYPISDIEILSDIPAGEGAADVNAVARFGGTASDATISVPAPENDGWKVARAATAVDFGFGGLVSSGLRQFVTIFGQPIPSTGKAYLFPGWVDIGSSNPNLSIVEWLGDEPSMNAVGAQDARVRLRAEITEVGEEAVRAEVKKLLDECAQSNLFAPPGCPQRLRLPEYFVEGTVRWEAPTDLSGVDVSIFDPMTGKALVFVSATYRFEAQTTRPREVPDVIKRESVSMTGYVDMTKNPPVLELESR